MADVRLPLKLSTSFYIAVSTSSVGEDISPTSDAPLFTSTKPAFKFFRLPNFTKERKSHGTKDGNAKKVAMSPNWPFFRVVKSKGSETCSPSPSQDSSSSSGSSVNDEGDAIESLASQKSPPDEKSSPGSSISPSSVLGKKPFIEKEAGMVEKSSEDGGRKLGPDSLESFMSCNDARKFSSLVEGEKGMKYWDGTFDSSARYDHQLPRSTPCSVKDIIMDEDDDELFELDITKSESSFIYGDPWTKSLRRSIRLDILKAEAGNAMENSSTEISEEEEIQGDDLCLCDVQDGNPGKASKVAPSLPDGKEAITCRGDNPHFVLRLFERFSASSHFVLFKGKMLGAIGLSQGSNSTMLWMELKKRIVLSSASLRAKHGVSGGEVLWKKNIPMGRRCRVLEFEEDSSFYENGERRLRAVAAKDAADVHMNPGGDQEGMTEGLSLHELMEAAAEAPVFNWTSKEARSFY